MARNLNVYEKDLALLLTESPIVTLLVGIAMHFTASGRFGLGGSYLK